MAINPSTTPAVLNILAVEDDPSVAQAIAAVLRVPGCHIVVASGAHEALEAMEREPQEFDVVITDNLMPAVPGGELVRRLRQRNFAGKIVVLSATVSPKERADYMKLGVSVILQKPFAVADLRHAVGL